MAIEASYDSADDIPQDYKHLFVERDGEHVLLGAPDLVDPENVTRLQSALTKEKADHKAARVRAGKFGDLDPDEVRAQLDRIPELEIAADGKMDESKIAALAEARAKTLLAPVERKLLEAEAALQEREQALTQYAAKETRREVVDLIDAAAQKLGLHDQGRRNAQQIGVHIMERNEAGDIVTRDGVEGRVGVPPAEWLADILADNEHWLPPSQGGGARGGSGGSDSAPNPWSFEHWSYSAQLKEETADPARAKRRAESVGSRIGGTKPAAPRK